jgi:hypothetical protein
MGKRYFLFPIYDAWTNVIHSAGSRTSGEAAQTILITGPSWQGTPPAGMTHVKSPTNLAFVIGRVYSDGTPADMAKVHAVQKQFQLVPLSAHGQSYTPPKGQTGGPYTPKHVVRDVIAGMSTEEYFTFLADAMKDNPPVMPRDTAIVARMAKIGLVPGQPFDMNQLSPEARKAIEDLPKKVTAEFGRMESEGLGAMVNGWLVPAMCGNYGTDYRNRAVVSAFGWGCNLPQDAVYPRAKVDAAGKPLNGSNTYVMRFKNGNAPPVRGFWSITMYRSDYYFYPNPWNKLTVSPRDQLAHNPDGSFNLYFSHVRPAGIPQANWLPAPPDNFILAMRLYWPKEAPPSILSPGKPTWDPPAVKIQPVAGRALPPAAVQAAPPGSGPGGGMALPKLAPYRHVQDLPLLYHMMLSSTS